MKKAAAVAAIACAMVVLPALAEAQRLSVEPRGGLVLIPEEEVTGPAYGITGIFHVTSWLGVYGTYSQETLRDPEYPEDFTVQMQGAGFGVQLDLGPLWVRGGTVPSWTLTIHDEDEFGNEPGRFKSTGISAGAGIGISLSPRLKLVPGIRALVLTFPEDDEEFGGDVLPFVGADVGLRIRL